MGNVQTDFKENRVLSIDMDFYKNNNRRASYSILQVRATRGLETPSRRKSAVFDTRIEQKTDSVFETQPASPRKDRRRSSVSGKSERSIWNSSRRLSVTNFCKEAHKQRIPGRFSVR